MWVDLSDILCMEPFQHTAVERLAEGSDILLALVGSEYLDQDLDDSKAKEIIILLSLKKKSSLETETLLQGLIGSQLLKLSVN